MPKPPIKSDIPSLGRQFGSEYRQLIREALDPLAQSAPETTPAREGRLSIALPSIETPETPKTRKTRKTRKTPPDPLLDPVGASREQGKNVTKYNRKIRQRVEAQDKVIEKALAILDRLRQGERIKLSRAAIARLRDIFLSGAGLTKKQQKFLTRLNDPVAPIKVDAPSPEVQARLFKERSQFDAHSQRKERYEGEQVKAQSNLARVIGDIGLIENSGGRSQQEMDIGAAATIAQHRLSTNTNPEIRILDLLSSFYELPPRKIRGVKESSPHYDFIQQVTRMSQFKDLLLGGSPNLVYTLLVPFSRKRRHVFFGLAPESQIHRKSGLDVKTRGGDDEIQLEEVDKILDQIEKVYGGKVKFGEDPITTSDIELLKNIGIADTPLMQAVFRARVGDEWYPSLHTVSDMTAVKFRARQDQLTPDNIKYLKDNYDPHIVKNLQEIRDAYADTGHPIRFKDEAAGFLEVLRGSSRTRPIKGGISLSPEVIQAHSTYRADPTPKNYHALLSTTQKFVRDSDIDPTLAKSLLEDIVGPTKASQILDLNARLPTLRKLTEQASPNIKVHSTSGERSLSIPQFIRERSPQLHRDLKEISGAPLTPYPEVELTSSDQAFLARVSPEAKDRMAHPIEELRPDDGAEFLDLLKRSTAPQISSSKLIETLQHLTPSNETNLTPKVFGYEDLTEWHPHPIIAAFGKRFPEARGASYRDLKDLERALLQDAGLEAWSLGQTGDSTFGYLQDVPPTSNTAMQTLKALMAEDRPVREGRTQKIQTLFSDLSSPSPEGALEKYASFSRSFFDAATLNERARVVTHFFPQYKRKTPEEAVEFAHRLFSQLHESNFVPLSPERAAKTIQLLSLGRAHATQPHVASAKATAQAQILANLEEKARIFSHFNAIKTYSPGDARRFVDLIQRRDYENNKIFRVLKQLTDTATPLVDPRLGP